MGRRTDSEITSPEAAWTDEYIRVPKVVAWQAGKVIGERRLAWPAAPGRVFRILSSLFDAAGRGGGQVMVGIDGATQN